MSWCCDFELSRSATYVESANAGRRLAAARGRNDMTTLFPRDSCCERTPLFMNAMQVEAARIFHC
jgi:hypothetical protein